MFMASDSTTRISSGGAGKMVCCELESKPVLLGDLDALGMLMKEDKEEQSRKDRAWMEDCLLPSSGHDNVSSL